MVLDAPGYARASQQIVLAEKETKDVAFFLQPAAGIVYVAPPPRPHATSIPWRARIRTERRRHLPSTPTHGGTAPRKHEEARGGLHARCGRRAPPPRRQRIQGNRAQLSRRSGSERVGIDAGLALREAPLRRCEVRARLPRRREHAHEISQVAGARTRTRTTSASTSRTSRIRTAPPSSARLARGTGSSTSTYRGPEPPRTEARPSRAAKCRLAWGSISKRATGSAWSRRIAVSAGQVRDRHVHRAEQRG